MFKWLCGILAGLCLTFALPAFYPQSTQAASGCDKSYPDFCILRLLPISIAKTLVRRTLCCYVQTLMVLTAIKMALGASLGDRNHHAPIQNRGMVLLNVFPEN